ncbi:MAG TPA: GNAT family N-acetyltransferase [Hyphomonadaceae bacterium]|nr:GNAT family N-acetyltransferase [Hyphomonadaceae bacterium]
MSHPPDDHPLDRPIWGSLNSHQSYLRQGAAPAIRFPVDISPFVVGQDASPGTALALSKLIPPGDDVYFIEASPPPAPEGVSSVHKAVVQMVWTDFPASPAPVATMEDLDDSHAAEMLALATLTRPGPFRTRTHTLGRFIGVREKGELIAMAGERMHLTGYREISAVCTHPDHRGKGLGAMLMHAVGARIRADGEQSFLHAYADNHVAIALYRKLGFEVRRELTHALWKHA